MNAIEQRLQDLANQPLLPQKHVDFLWALAAYGVQPKVIYDVGACVLHWTSVATKVWSDAQIIAFEAMPEVESLYRRAGVAGIYGAVLSDQVGKLVEFYQNTEHPGGNSYYKENIDHNPVVDQYFNDSHKRVAITTTLDRLVSDFFLPKPDFIKMDIQGAELDALKGATNILPTVQHLILELQHVEYNKGAPNCQEVIQYLDSQGFDLVERFVATNVDGDYYFRRR
jgi:FkbM family methyltransferase